MRVLRMAATGLWLLTATLCGATDEPDGQCVLQTGAILRVTLPNHPGRLLKAGSFSQGRLDRPAYNRRCQVLPQGSSVRIVVDHIERRSRKLFPLGWVKRAAGKPGEPPAVILGSIEVELPGKVRVPVKASFLRLETEKHVEAAKQPGARSGHTHVLLLRIDEALRVAGADPGPGQKLDSVLAAGTRVHVDLDSAASSAKNRDGDTIRARVTQPVIVDGNVVVPEGAVVEGSVARSKRARRPYRSGGLRLSFQSLRLSPARVVDSPATLAAGDFASTVNFDQEGGLTGGPLDRKRALLNIGVAYLTGKIVDDIFEESVKAILGAAVSGSAATAARYIGLTTGAVFFLMHRGRDVRLESHTAMELTFSRDVLIHAPPD
jgi:hypothetical protein